LASFPAQKPEGMSTMQNQMSKQESLHRGMCGVRKAHRAARHRAAVPLCRGSFLR